MKPDEEHVVLQGPAAAGIPALHVFPSQGSELLRHCAAPGERCSSEPLAWAAALTAGQEDTHANTGKTCKRSSENSCHELEQRAGASRLEATVQTSGQSITETQLRHQKDAKRGEN